MPGYIKAALFKYQYPEPRKPQHAPHKWEKPQYGQTKQYAKPVEKTPKLDAEGIKHIQKVIGTLLHYARTIDSTTLMAINAISSDQVTGTTTTADAVTWLLDYAATYPNATIHYKASKMILRIHSDASYQLDTESHSHAGGHLFLVSNNHTDTSEKNSAIHTTCEIIKNVMSAASEAECGATFINCKAVVPLRITLEEMGHEKPPTPVQIYNSTTEGIMNSTMQQKRPKAMDMRFYWIQDRIKQKNLKVFWKPGTTNLGDYHTKHHAPNHHRNGRKNYIHCPGIPRKASARVC